MFVVFLFTINRRKCPECYTQPMKILITGVAGTGKTTALAELQKRGYLVIDLDATGLCRWRNKETGAYDEYGENL